MDTITHALLGAAASDAIFGKKLGRKAALAGAIAGALPDIDMIASFGGSWSMLEWHRSITHSVFVLPFMAAITGAFFWRFLGKKENFLPWYLVGFIAILLHIVLDLCTSWGTEALWPFSAGRFAWDSMPIIDPLFTLPLIVWAIMRMFPKIKPYSSRIATAAFAWCFAYCMGGFYMNDRAQDIARDNSEYPQEAVRSRAIPQVGSTFLWNVIKEYPDGNFSNIPVSTFTSHALSPMSVFTSGSTENTRKVLGSPEGRLLLRATQGFLATTDVSGFIESASKSGRVQLLDMRYTFPDETGKPANIFTSEAIIRHDGSISVRRSSHRPRNPGRFIRNFTRIFTTSRATAPPAAFYTDRVESPAEID